MRRSWQGSPQVTIPVFIPTCPADEGGCGSTNWTHVRGEENGDTTSTEWVVCADCLLTFKIIRERFPVRESICWTPE